MEKFYGWFGQVVAKYPLWVILACLIFAALCGIGFLNLENETDQLELWVPTDSDFYRNNKWIAEKFPSSIRSQSVMLYTQDPNGNILTKENLKQLDTILNSIANLR